ncbi:MAG: class I SAM-dependent methyltransferase [Rubrobacteraceae bacterium]
MPVYKSRVVFEIKKGLRAFLNLEAGLSRGGEVPDFEQEFKRARERIAQKDRRISALQKELAGAKAGARPRPARQKVASNGKGTPAGADDLAPPEELQHLGGAGRGYRAIGQRWFKLLTTELGGLRPHESVLDVGCGVGRIAAPLTGYLTTGTYDGFDIAPEGIAWCQENITPRYPNFRFQTADIYNKRYNPEGGHTASNYEFPYEDGSFDLVFLASIFTHLLPEDMENYFSEISRVLKDGGRCVISYFLLNERSVKFIEAGQFPPGVPRFVHDHGNYRVQSEEVPEEAIAHDEQEVRKLYNKYGLSIVEPVRYGAWAGGENSSGGQDVILAKKD